MRDMTDRNNQVQRCEFSNGGFVMHKLRIASSDCKFSAWFNRDGELLSAERIDKLGRSVAATKAQCAELARKGRVFA